MNMSDYGVKIGIKADTGTVNCVCSGKCCRQLIPKCDRPGKVRVFVAVISLSTRVSGRFGPTINITL